MGVFNSSWATTYYWNTDATIKVTGGPAFTSSATATPATIGTAGSSVIAFSVEDTGAALQSANVEVQVFNSSDKVVGTGVFSQNFTTGQTQKYSWTWTPSKQSPVVVTAPGVFTVEIGVFNSEWSTGYYWNNSAAKISMTSP